MLDGIKVIKFSNRPKIQQASVESIPYTEEHFNKIYTANTIYFWPNPLENIQEIRRVLKRDGIFYCALCLKEEMEMMPVVSSNLDVFHNLYHEKDIKELFKEAGCRDVELCQELSKRGKICIVKGIK